MACLAPCQGRSLNTITITLTGKGPWAAGYYAGFDYLLLSPAS